MRPAKFDYFCPSTLAEAAALLAQSEGMGRILAGGQSLMPAMNLRLSKPSRLIDLRKIPGLGDISIQQGKVHFGALVRHAQIIGNEDLNTRIPIFREAGLCIAHATIREHGTIGGSLALADPAAEWATVMSLLGARVHAVSTAGDRWVPIEEFFVSYYTTALDENEIIVGVEVPIPARSTSYGFSEFSRQAGAFALAMVAVSMEVQGGATRNLKAWIGGCAARPQRVPLDGVEGSLPLDAAIDSAFDAMGLDPSGDIQAAAEDRMQIARTLLKRCITATRAIPARSE